MNLRSFKRGWVFVAAVLLAGGTGCASLPDGRAPHRAGFDAAQRMYTQLVRWGEFERASEYVTEDERKAFVAEAPDHSQTRFSDYKIREVDFNEDGSEATARVSYRTYSLFSLVEKVVVETQVWSRDAVTGRWEVQPGLAALRESVQISAH